MASYVYKLTERELIKPPYSWLRDNVQYETIMGSLAYGVSNDASDMDIYGFAIPPKEFIFPHMRGEIEGFGTQFPRFHQYQQHHIVDQEARKEYDLTIYNIVKYFQLCMENNPNMIDSLFTPNRCVTHVTEVGSMIRERRRLFLHKRSWHTFKGYAYAQMKKIKDKNNRTNPKRAASIEKYGYDVKFAYHVVRLLNEAEQIMMTGDLDLEQNNEQLKAIRRGEWTLEQLETWANEKERQLEGVYLTSTLPYAPNETEIKNLLLDSLEHHYGSLNNVVAKPDSLQNLLRDLYAVMGKYS